MMFSLLTATHSRQVALSIGYSRPEEAYVCGLMRNLGEVLIARYYGREYADVVTMMQESRIPLRAAAVRTFQFDFDHLAIQMTELWNMPSSVRLCLENGATAASPEQRCLASVANYGHELTSVLYRYAVPVESDPIQQRTVVNPEGNLRRLAPSDLRRVVDTATEDTEQTFVTLRIPIESLHLAEQAETARHLLEDGRLTSIRFDGDQVDRTIQEATAGLEVPTFEVSSYIQGLLEALSDHGGFDRALFALISEDHESIHARLGSGINADEAIASFSFRLGRGDPILHGAIQRRQDLWINGKTDLRYESSPVKAVTGATYMVVLPVIVQDIVVGVLYADQNHGQPPEGLRPRVEQIRDLIARAVDRRRLAQ
jgi:hypothetical protein